MTSARKGRLEGKIAIVSGAGSGIGAGCAIAIAREGARVVGADVNLAAVEATAAEAAKTGGEVAAHRADLTRPDEVEALMAATVARHGGLDILANAAAVAEFRWIEDMDYDLHWRRTLTGELDIVFLSCQAAWPWLIRRGGGAIVNLASANAYVALKHSPALAHCAGKGAFWR